MTIDLINLLYILILLIVSLKYILSLVHLLQLESYYTYGFIKRNPYKPPFGVINYKLLFLDLLSLIFVFLDFKYHFIFAGLVLLPHFLYKRKGIIKPLKYTSRVKRLLVVNILILIFLIYYCRICFYFIRFLLPVFVAFSNLLLYPIEYFLRYYYKSKAKSKIRILKQKGTQIIGITGSFGKTSVKYILATILSEEYKVAFTPSSFNTPMGISLFVNSDLKEEYYDFVIFEMGARHRYDIKELSYLCQPDIGIITEIGPQHLETFKTVENILKTKTELYDYIKERGEKLFYNNCNSFLHGYLKGKEKTVPILCNDNGFEILKMDVEGMDLMITDGKDKYLLKTNLIGKANAFNISFSAIIAYNMGISWDKIKRGVAKLQPIPHRLQILPKTTNGLIIIDDAFNANIEGIKNAMDAISRMNGHRRIVVTPGIVEAGEKEYEINKEAGKIIAEVADMVVIVKGRNRSRMDGLLDGIRNSTVNYIIIDSMLDFNSKVVPILREGDILLFENDIPDNW